MKVLVVHNSYRYSGGEDVVFNAEVDLLRTRGDEVVTIHEDNAAIASSTLLSKGIAAGRAIWSQPSYDRISQAVRKHKPDVAHFHNTFPLVSPSGYYACRRMGVPVVQTLHNYRLTCPAASLFRDGAVCEDCITSSLLRSVQHACYRQSWAATATLAAMLAFHRRVGTWDRMVDLYIALTDFARAKFMQSGLPASKLAVKPNFMESDTGVGQHSGNYALFVGRLSPEKGLNTLIRAWEGVDMDLLIAGDGPMKEQIIAQIEANNFGRVQYLGAKPRKSILELMKDARFLLFPSEWYEGFPLTIVESYACGTPLIASRIGSVQEIVQDRRTGLLFAPGDAADLATKVRWAVANPEAMRNMGNWARKEYEAKYTPEQNYTLLKGIYMNAIGIGVPSPGAEPIGAEG